MSGLRERKKERTRRELSEAAMKLFRTVGYEQTTIDAIAEIVGVSSRTFFRYYDSKEAVLFGEWREYLTAIAEFVRERPSGESLNELMKELCRTMAAGIEADREHQLFIKRIVSATPSAGDYESRILLPAYRKTLVQAICERDGRDPMTDMAPALMAAVSLAALREAKLRWIESPDHSLVDLLEEAFEALETLF